MGCGSSRMVVEKVFVSGGAAGNGTYVHEKGSAGRGKWVREDDDSWFISRSSKFWFITQRVDNKPVQKHYRIRGAGGNAANGPPPTDTNMSPNLGTWVVATGSTDTGGFLGGTVGKEPAPTVTYGEQMVDSETGQPAPTQVG